MFHLVKSPDQFPHLILILNRHILAAKVISGNFTGTVGQSDHRVDQGIGQ